MLGLNGPADVTSSELYLSLGRAPQPHTTPPGEFGSHPASPSSSRASSPERSCELSTSHSLFGTRSSQHHFNIRPFTAFSKHKTLPSSTGAGTGGTPSSHTNSRTRPSARLSRSSSGPSTPSSPDSHSPHPLPSALPPMSRSSTSPARTSASLVTATSALGEYYDAVPEYTFAARGFLGGGITPLSSFRGLPSYDQAQRSRASSPQGDMQVTSVTSTMSATSAASEGSCTSGGSRRRGSIGGSGRASVVGERQSPPLHPLPPSPPPSSRPSSR